MKYIEENFNNTYVQNLSNDEIRHINTFLREIISIKAVECILLIPEYREIDRRYYDDIYCEIEIKIIMHQEPRALKRVEKSICEARPNLPFISYIPTNKFEFEITDVNSFISDSVIIKSWSETALVSSYILFDRNGIFEKFQDELRTSKRPFEGLSKIGNIDELSMDSPKKEGYQLIINRRNKNEYK